PPAGGTAAPAPPPPRTQTAPCRPPPAPGRPSAALSWAYLPFLCGFGPRFLPPAGKCRAKKQPRQGPPGALPGLRAFVVCLYSTGISPLAGAAGVSSSSSSVSSMSKAAPQLGQTSSLSSRSSSSTVLTAPQLGQVTS